MLYGAPWTVRGLAAPGGEVAQHLPRRILVLARRRAVLLNDRDYSVADARDDCCVAIGRPVEHDAVAWLGVGGRGNPSRVRRAHVKCVVDGPDWRDAVKGVEVALRVLDALIVEARG